MSEQKKDDAVRSFLEVATDTIVEHLKLSMVDDLNVTQDYSPVLKDESKSMSSTIEFDDRVFNIYVEEET